MKYKTKVIVFASLIACLAILVIGVALFADWRENKIIKEYFIEDSMNYLISEKDFCEKYGTPVSLTSDDVIPIRVEAEHKTFYMDFECETDRQKLSLRVIAVLHDQWEYQYIIDPEGE